MLHWGLGRRFARWGPSSLVDSDAAALIAAMTVPPDATRQALISDTITAIKAAGVWTKLDILYVLAAHDAQAARLNWKTPGTFTATLVGAPAFVTDRGYTGASTTRLDTGCNPATAGGAFVQDSAHMGAWGNSEGAVGGGQMIANGSSACFFSPQNDASSGRARVNTGTSQSIVTASAIAHFIVIRRDAVNQIAWRNGVSASAAAASIAVTSANFVILNATNGAAPFTGQISVAHAGGALSDAEAAALSSPLATYRTAVGL